MKNYKDLTYKEKELYGFEYFCGACDNFKTEKCPFKNIAKKDSLWRKNDKGLGCTKFLD